ncbi:hypothetical protein OG905_14405 [Streptomyces sp. NBC_00322]|uniref:hypothetical protein n=1 Tax=Streptomyces sp. NBC_00322 TaxID=2975712 RepID=UPI002E29B8C4|nr:hypothetical protein [Streptomyces sp. NBC_00322]
MNTFFDYLFVIALFGLILLPALVGNVRERIVDRQLREAELGREDVRRARLLQAELREARRRSSTSAPVRTPVRTPVPSRTIVSPKSTPVPRRDAAAVKTPCTAE